MPQPMPLHLTPSNGRWVNDTHGGASYQYHVRRMGQVDLALPYCRASDGSEGPIEATRWNYLLGCFHGRMELPGCEIKDGGGIDQWACEGLALTRETPLLTSLLPPDPRTSGQRAPRAAVLSCCPPPSLPPCRPKRTDRGARTATA